MTTNNTDIIKSRRGYHNDYIGIILIGLMVLGLITRAIFPNASIDQPDNKVYVGMILVTVGFFYLLYTVITIPSLRFDKESLISKTLFKKSSIAWKDVESIKLTGKTYRKSIWSFEETATLNLKNGEKIPVWIEHYSNQRHIRLSFERINYSLVNNLPISVIPDLDQVSEHISNTYNFSETQKFAGNAFLNMNSLLFLGIIIFSAYMSSTKIGRYGIVLFLGFVGIFYLAFGSQLHYFLISGDKFIVRNHFFFWKNHVYDLGQIREFSIETPSKRSRSLRIIKKDFSVKQYSAGSLRERNWEKLGAAIKELKIPLRHLLW